MALAIWIEGQGLRGNMKGVEDGLGLLKKHDEVEHQCDHGIKLPTADQLAQKESKKWGREVLPPPLSLLEVQRLLIESRISGFEPMAVPKDDSFYWILMDISPQPYPGDFLEEVLGELRKEKKVEKHVEESSRFGLSPDEIDKTFQSEFLKLALYRNPKLGKVLGTRKGALRTPTENEFRFMFNNIPEVLSEGKGEWLHDLYGKDRRLVVMRSENGSLNVAPEKAGFYRSKSFGFRMVIDFSQDKPQEAPAKAA